MSGASARLRAAAIGGFRRLPPRWRERLKEAVGALGHRPGWAQRLRARELATGAKRLDRWAPELRRMLDTAGIRTLRGAACLEFGSGHLLTEPLLHHLLGAKRAVAADYFPILQPELIAAACRAVDEDALAGALGGLEEAELLRSRFRALATRRDWSLAALAGLGIAYVAPYDAAAGPLPGGERFDLIASCSVLEHVPRDAAGAILRNLAAMLKPGGVMVHAIHLEDHRDFAEAPFAFLAADTDWRDADADRRGNRLRARDWVALAQDLAGVELVAAETEVRNAPLPARLDPVFTGYAPDELRVKRLVLALRAPAGQMGA